MRPFTVYFDTNFFVWLGSADEVLAREIVEGLNALKIRHVLSDILIRELLTSAGRPKFDRVLVERLDMLGLVPYCTSDYLTWEALRGSGEERRIVADIFKALDEMNTEATSHSIIAGRIARGRVSSKKLADLEKQTLPFLEKLGLSLDPEDAEASLKSAQEFAERMIDNLRNVLPEGCISGELEWSGDPVEHKEMLLGMLNPKDVESAVESSRLNASTTDSEDRPYQVAAGIANTNTKRNLAHTLRDSEHMKTFIQHKDEIDLLQVDKAQLNLIKKGNPAHRLNELGLSEHCFSVSSLSEVLRVIENMKVN